MLPTVTCIGNMTVPSYILDWNEKWIPHLDIYLFIFIRFMCCPSHLDVSWWCYAETIEILLDCLRWLSTEYIFICLKSWWSWNCKVVKGSFQLLAEIEEWWHQFTVAFESSGICWYLKSNIPLQHSVSQWLLSCLWKIHTHTKTRMMISCCLSDHQTSGDRMLQTMEVLNQESHFSQFVK